MKTRDSGMPVEDTWTTFFDPEQIIRSLGLDRSAGRVLDVGCGYGTFTLPIARLTGRPVIGIDIEEPLARALEAKATAAGLKDVHGVVQDVASNGLGQPDASISVVLLFNILHCEEPLDLLLEAHRVLERGARVGVIHWRSDVSTPRGPALDIRPRPEQIRGWLIEAGFAIERGPLVLPPYHFGLVGMKPADR